MNAPQIATVNYIKETEVAFNNYKFWLQEIRSYSMRYPNHLLLYEMIKKLKNRKRDGDLQNVSDVPEVSEMDELLNAGKLYTVWHKFEKADKTCVEFIKSLKDPNFKQQFKLLPIEVQLSKKEEYLEALTFSKVGNDYIHECFTYEEPAVEFNELEAPIFSFWEIENDIYQLEIIRNDPRFTAKTGISIALKFLKFVQRCLPEMTKYTEVTLTRVQFISARMITVFYQDVTFLRGSGGLPTTFRLVQTQQTLVLVEEVETILLEVEELEVRNAFRDRFGAVLAGLGLIMTSVSLIVNYNKLRADPSLRNSVAFMGTFLGLIAGVASTYEKFVLKAGEFTSRYNIIWRSSLVVNGVSSYVIAPIQFCFAMEDVMGSIQDGNRRASWVGFWSAMSGIVGTGLAAAGVAGPVGVAIVLGFLAVGWIGSLAFDGELERRLKEWLLHNYFGKKSKGIDEYRNLPPTELRFEWLRDNGTWNIVKQISSLHSLLVPLNLAKVRSPRGLNEQFYELTLELERPSIAPVDFIVRIRFFNGNNIEVTDSREDTSESLSASQLGPWYIIPVNLQSPNTFPDNWVNNYNSWWLVDHSIDLITSDGQSSILLGVAKYSLKMKVHVYRRLQTLLGYQFVQVQVMNNTDKDIWTQEANRKDLESRFEHDPFVQTSTKSIRW